MDPFEANLDLLLRGPAGVAIAGVWGALWGSFFNVLIVRVPEGESVVRPASHCRGCRAPIAWYDNIPIASWLLLRGRCRGCGTKIPARYLLVEILVCALAMALHQTQFAAASGTLVVRASQLAIASLFSGLLVAIAFIDLATYRIPDVITYPGIPVAAILSLFMGHAHLWDGAAGAVLGYLVIRLIADGYRLATGRHGMGYGDAKLLALTGGLLGWSSILPTLFLAAFQGTFLGVGVLLVVRRGRRRAPDESADSGEVARSKEGEGKDAGEGPREGAAGEEAAKKGAGEGQSGGEESEEEERPGSLRHERIPFGPFLSLGAIEVLLLRDVLAGYLPFLF
jgi:leader peptidase (prepilin peptidase) / N-methyltransferase